MKYNFNTSQNQQIIASNGEEEKIIELNEIVFT